EGEGVYAVVAEVAVGLETYTDEDGLVPNTTYDYRLKLENGDQASAYTEVSVTTPPIPTAPEVVQQPMPGDGNQYVTIDAEGKAVLTWQGSENTETYFFFVGETADGLAQVAEIPAAEAPSYTLDGLVAGGSYFWRVDARNEKGTT